METLYHYWEANGLWAAFHCSIQLSMGHTMMSDAGAAALAKALSSNYSAKVCSTFRGAAGRFAPWWHSIVAHFAPFVGAPICRSSYQGDSLAKRLGACSNTRG